MMQRTAVEICERWPIRRRGEIVIAKASLLGQKVKEARKRQGLTLTLAAMRAGVDKGLLSKIESGERIDVRLSTAVALCRTLGLST